jgi:hypothetical protein
MKIWKRLLGNSDQSWRRKPKAILTGDSRLRPEDDYGPDKLILKIKHIRCIDV